MDGGLSFIALAEFDNDCPTSDTGANFASESGFASETFSTACVMAVRRFFIGFVTNGDKRVANGGPTAPVRTNPASRKAADARVMDYIHLDARS